MLASSAVHTTFAETTRPSFAVTVAVMLVVTPETRLIADDGDSLIPAGVLSAGVGPVESPPPPPHAAPNTAAATINSLVRRIERICRKPRDSQGLAVQRFGTIANAPHRKWGQTPSRKWSLACFAGL